MNKFHIGLGIFVVGTLTLLVWLAQSIGALGGGGGNTYELRLAHAAGLVENNAVKIAGVSVGRIEKVAVDHDVAVLTLRIDEEVVLHTDTMAIVRAKSLLGEKYLQLHPGERDSPVLESGQSIEHVETPFEIDEVLNALEPILGGDDSIAAALAPLAKTLNELLNDAAGKSGKPAIISREEIEQLVDDLKATSASVRRTVEGNEQTLNELLASSNKLVGDPRIPKIIGNTERITTELDKKLPGLLERGESVLTKLEKLAAVVDDERSRKIGTIIDDASVATANLRDLSDDLKDVSKVIIPLTKDLATIAKRAAEIDSNVVRRFLQREGVKVYFGSKKKAEAALEEVPSD